MVRRLLLTCATLLFQTLAQATCWVVFVAIVTLVIEQETKAYINPFLSAFTNVCCYQILLFVLFQLLVRGGVRLCMHSLTMSVHGEGMAVWVWVRP